MATKSINPLLKEHTFSMFNTANNGNPIILKYNILTNRLSKKCLNIFFIIFNLCMLSYEWRACDKTHTLPHTTNHTS